MMPNEVPKGTDLVSESLLREPKEVSRSQMSSTVAPNEVIFGPKEVTLILNKASIWPNEVT